MDPTLKDFIFLRLGLKILVKNWIKPFLYFSIAERKVFLGNPPKWRYLENEFSANNGKKQFLKQNEIKPELIAKRCNHSSILRSRLLKRLELTRWHSILWIIPLRLRPKNPLITIRYLRWSCLHSVMQTWLKHTDVSTIYVDIEHQMDPSLGSPQVIGYRK